MWQRLSVFLIGLILLSACQDDTKTTVYNAPEKPTLSLQIATATNQNVPRYYSATGYTTIARTIEISTSQSGTIKKLQVDEGDVVKAGELLIVIDESELLTTIKQAISTIKSARINLKDRQQDFNTSKRLRQSKVIPAEQFRKAKVQLDLANAQLVQANSELKRQKARKPYYRITSPIAARVVKRWVSQGDLSIIGKPLLQLEAIKGLQFETALPTQWLDQIHVGDTYKLQLYDSGLIGSNKTETNKKIEAKVSHIIHSANRITQTCQIKLSLPDSNRLSPGLSGQIDFIIAKEKKVLIPESSLIKRAGVQGVFRLNDRDAVQFTPVKTERRWQHQWVILSGLKSGESVVLNPPAKLRDGVRIKTAIEVAK